MFVCEKEFVLVGQQITHCQENKFNTESPKCVAKTGDICLAWQAEFHTKTSHWTQRIVFTRTQKARKHRDEK